MPAVGLMIVAASLWQQPSPAPLQFDSVPDTVAASSERTAPAGPVLPVVPARVVPVLFAGDSTTPQRPHAIEYSRLYEARLTIHHWASFASLPLFAAEYLIGQKLITDSTRSGSLNGAHQAVATGIAGLFALNTVTGAWNLWDSRKDPNGRVRRYVHSALMLVADAGFVATAGTAPDDDRFGSRLNGASRHRAIAITSMTTALAGYALMLIWKN